MAAGVACGRGIGFANGGRDFSKRGRAKASRRKRLRRRGAVYGAMPLDGS